RDLPGAWAEALRSAIGVRPPSDRDGCLQDIHWYDGAWGYFPTYTLGALIAAQLFAALRQALPDIADRIGRGEFAPVFEWLRAHIHGKGSLFSTAGDRRPARHRCLRAPPVPALPRIILKREGLQPALNRPYVPGALLTCETLAKQ